MPPSSQSEEDVILSQGAHDLIGQAKPRPQKVPGTDGTGATALWEFLT